MSDHTLSTASQSSVEHNSEEGAGSNSQKVSPVVNQGVETSIHNCPTVSNKEAESDTLIHPTEGESGISIPAQGHNSGVDIGWNFDGMEDKNPFSGMSEEHLNKLDEVLSSVNVQELLQQTNPELNLLNLDGTEQLPGAAGSSARRDSSDSLPESIVSVVFSDHGYCLNPEKAGKVKPFIPQTVSKSPNVLVTVEPSSDDVTCEGFPTALNMSTDSPSDSDAKTESPLSSPRKSGRAHTKSKYLDAEWITSSPSKGRGRGRGAASPVVTPFGLRASSRISDQKQRDLAEKIMLANRQAMQAEKTSTEDADMNVSKSPQKSKSKGSVKISQGKKSPGRSSMEDEESDKDGDDLEEDKEENDSEEEDVDSEEDEVEEKSAKKLKGKVDKKKKKGGKYEEDSDFVDETGGKNVKKTKGKKKGKNDAVSDTETVVAKGKKGKKKKAVKGKKKGKEKVGKKLKGKAGKVDEETQDSDESDEESESKSEVKEKSPKKSNKKLTKKERLKKLKEAKAAKRAKLLEKKKSKKKDKKTGKVEATEKASPAKTKVLPKGKVVGVKKKSETDNETTDASPKGKKTKAAEQKSPKAAEKRKASPARAAKLKGTVASPAKKPKLTRQQLAKQSKADIQDSDDDKPLASMKGDSKESKPSATTEKISSPVRGEMNIFSNLSVGLGTDAITSESSKAKTEVKSVETLKVDIQDKNVEHKEIGDKESTHDSGIEKKEILDNSSTKKSVGKQTQNKEADKTVDIVSPINSNEIEEGADKNKDLDESKKRQDSEDNKPHHHHHHHHRHRTHSKDSNNEEKTESGSQSQRHDSRDRKDSQSHRESSERRHSRDRRESHSSDKDRKSSKSSRDKDRHSRKSSDSSEKVRKDSVKGRRESSSDTRNDSKKSSGVKDFKESISTVSSSSTAKVTKGIVGTKKIGKDGKGKLKKSKKNDEMTVDSSMIDLFKPDNLPVAVKEESETKTASVNDEIKEKSEEKERVSKVKFLDTSDSSSKEIGIPDEKALVGPEIIKLESVKTSSGDTEAESDVKNEVSVEAMDIDDDSESVNKNSKQENNAMEIDVDLKLEDKNDSPENKTDELNEKCEDNESDKKVGVSESDRDVIGIDKKETLNVEDVVKKESVDAAPETAAVDDTKDVKKVVAAEVKKETNKPKKPLRMSDFFSERRLKINDPKPRQKVVKVAVSEQATTESSSGRQRRNKNVAFAEILKKEKLGSDDEEHSESEFEDDENDEDFEDPDQLYCICRQPHNQRFMICCDKCEEWFHGNCVGISKSRGAEMEKNNEEYVCPNCVSKDGAIQDGSVVSTTQSPEHPNKKSQNAGKSKVNEKSVAEDSKSIKPDSTVDKDSTTVVKSKQDTPRSKTTKSQGEATPKSQSGGSQSSKSKKELKSTHKTNITKGQVTPKSEEKSKDGGSVKKGDLMEKRKRVIQMVKEEVEGKDKPKQPYNKCFTCNTRPPRRDSLYCSDECRQKHSKHNVAPGILKVTVIKDIKKSKEKHIAVVDKSTGRTLTGEKAPTESELKKWLQDNPTYEVLKSHNKMEAKPLGLSSSDKKREEKDSSKTSKSEKSAKSEKDKGPEPIRLNVRKGLRDALAARADAADDIMLSNSEIKGLALSIEEELFKYFKDTDSKYKAKYRSLLFNIRDQKNKGLFRKILNRKIRASKLVRMSADELANKELAQWREQETKHTIEMIKQIETKHLNEPVHVMKKTHKGEEEVADEEGEDLSALAGEPKKPQETPKLEQNQTEEGDDELDTTDTHGQHLFDANCKICTGKQVPTLETTPTKSKASSSDTNVAIEKELTKSQHDLKADEVVKEVLKAIQRAKEDERKEQQRSSVTVRSPDSALSSGLDKNVKFTPIGPMLWKGFIYMQDVSKFVTTAYRVTGPAEHLVIPDTITLCGRISPEHVWDYLSKVKQSATRDICVIRFIPGINEEKVAYINLYSYLNSRSRCGVVEHRAKNIKDFYIVPLASHSKIPSVLKPFDGPGLEENRCHMLLGVIIRNKIKGSNSSSSDSSKSSHSHRSRHGKSQPLKSALKHGDDTPDKSSESSTPRTSSSSSTPQTSSSVEKRSISFDPIVKEYSHVTEQEMAIEPVSDDPLDLNAPYDPEKEVLKEAAKPKKEDAQQDTVTKMIDKIAQSKNPAEATAAMVAALATTSKLGNQRKLLMELTKKVDEQKRLLEQKRISSKFGQSPLGSSPGSSKISSTSSLGISSKDPRLRNQSIAQQAVDTAADAQDLDLRVKPGMTTPSHASSVPASKTSVLPPSISATALENSVSILSSLTSDIASNVASPVKVSSTQSSDSSNKPFSLTTTSHSAASTTVLTKNSESDKTNRSDVSEPVKPKGFYVDHAHSSKDKAKVDIDSGIVVSDSAQKKTFENLHKADFKSKSDKTSDSKDKNNSDDHSEKNKGAQHDIVTQLMAEVSGKSTDMAVKTQSDSKEDKEMDPGKEPPLGTSKTNVPNVTKLLKNLGSDKSDSGKKSSIQLPSALMSLFSKLPGSVEDPQEEKQTQIPGFFTSENEETVDTDLRKSGDKKQGSIVPGLGDVRSDGKLGTLADENLSKSFMGFDYDSDSSGGSFEGFDDDGTKKLSPRKRKLVQKSARELSPKTNIFGDVDERPVADIDMRAGNDVDLRQDSKLDVKDIDDRMHMALAPSMDQPRPPGEGPRPSLPPHSALGLPFMPSDQPPPPGEDWSHPTTTQMAVGMPNIHPTSVEWSHAPLPESQPPLPAEPPMPKPPEPPMKKKKWDDFNQFDEGSDNETDGKGQSKNSRKKKKKKAKKDKKGGSVTSDERLQQIILEIAKNEPKKPQQVAPGVPPPGMPFVPPPQGMMPMVSMGVPPPVPCAMPPSCPPIPGTMPLPTSGWMGDGVIGAGLTSQSALQPPPIPPHRQPGVIPNPQLSGSHMELAPPGISHAGPSHPKFSNKPPSLLDLPTLPPPTKLLANKPDVVNASPVRETNAPSENSREVSESIFVPPGPETDDQVAEVSSFNSSSERTNVDERSSDRDRDERHRRDRHRSRSGDRSRRSRSGDRETDHRRGRSRDYDHRRYDDRDRDSRHHGRDRDRWHRRR